MPFAKIETRVDFPALERQTLAFWDQTQSFEKLRAKNRGKPKWSFLDGPITANNPMGVHHAWGRTYKDAFQRYHAMTGRELRYQNGFDCQGLWVEVEVEKELGLKSKRDIENLVAGDVFASIDRFVQLCKQRVDRFARTQTDQSVRLGYWMDWDRSDADWARPPDERRSYFTMSQENNYTIWGFLKKCHDRGLMYRGFDAMPWCPRCGVGISQMEMNEGYRVVAHKAVFLRFPLRDRPGENLLVWTTTPWTLTSNVGAAVHPDLAYLRVKQGDQIYYVGEWAFKAPRLEEQFKDKSQWVEGVPKLKTIEQLFKERKGGYEILGTVRGAELVDERYAGPFDDLPAQQHPGGFPDDLAQVTLRQKWAPAVSAAEAHRVVPWKEVSESEGTGIVHIAPGCGKEDFGLGKEVGLPPVAPLHEDGNYADGFGWLTGKQAVDRATADVILAHLQEKGVLFATEQYPHRYPHCWRCGTELLYRLVDEWFIEMSWREEIMRVCHDIRWIPKDGLDRELDWLRNMGDWMISKKRYWGLALPIWVDPESGDFEVLGSREELEQRAVEGWTEFAGHTPHRPWIDRIKIRNPKTGNLMSRIPDVGNPWLDAGIVPFSTLGYRSDRAHWQAWYPADFITECFPGQFRNWFYALLAMSTMLEGRAPFKTLLGHALVRDEQGEEMHKSRGNALEFNETADKMGADVMRWLFLRNNPTSNINFGFGPADEVRNKFVLKLWNTYAFFCNYARLDGFDPQAPSVPVAQRPDIDRWMLSDLQLLVRDAHAAFQDYNVMGFCLAAEQFVDDRLSNWYVRRNRRRFWKAQMEGDKLAAYQTLYTVLTTLCRLLAPITPFLTETMYQNLVRAVDPAAPESVHHADYPVADESLLDAELSADMDALLRLVRLGAATRSAAKIKVRQPVAELVIVAANDRELHAGQRFNDQLRDELNVKQVPVEAAGGPPRLKTVVKPNFKVFGRKFGSDGKKIEAALAAATADAAAALALAASLASSGSYELALPEGAAVTLAAEDVLIDQVAPAGYVGLVEHGTQLLLDTRITPELAAEGWAREAVRHIQELRKTAGLEMDDRINLALVTDSPPLAQALATHQETIATETLATTLSTTPLPAPTAATQAKIEGHALTIQLGKSIRQ